VRQDIIAINVESIRTALMAQTGRSELQQNDEL
jgi:hypothetical protein